jgi:hypothetical protein
MGTAKAVVSDSHGLKNLTPATMTLNATHLSTYAVNTAKEERSKRTTHRVTTHSKPPPV